MPTLNLSALLPALIAAVVTVIAMAALRRYAAVVGLLDHPHGHKTHHGAIPVVGGLAMFVGFAAAVVMTPGGGLDELIFLVSGGSLVVIGALDDAFELSPWLRLAAHIVAAVWMFSASTPGVRLEDLGNLFGLGAVEVTPVSMAATVFVVVAAINAFNMLDGMDGLAGGIAFIALGLLLWAVPAPIAPGFHAIVTALFGAVAGFLLFNAPLGVNRQLRSFMGDAGSTLLGFALATALIGSSQGAGRVAAPVTTVWLVLIPATDLWWSVLRRLARGQSPFHADNEHLHHLLTQAGLSTRAAGTLLVALSFVAGSVGIALDREHAPEWLSLLLLIASGVAIILTARGLRNRQQAIRARVNGRAAAKA